MGKTPKRCCRSDHTVETQQHALSGSLVMRKNPKRSCRSDHTVMAPKLQVELPLHLVVDQIFTRLPVKTLRRFCCVSKPLRSFISDPHFQKLHARRSQQAAFIVAKSDETGLYFSTYTIHGERLLKDFFISFARHINFGKTSSITNILVCFSRPSKIGKTSFDLIQSCLGLVCLRVEYNGAILIFNPSTAEVITLPERPYQIFDQRIGFGYTNFSDEFKVVRFFIRHIFGDFALALDLDPHNEVCISEVFTLGSSDGWRETRSPPPFKPCGNSHIPLAHGALHFLPSLHYHPDMRDGHYISAFDLSTEQYRGIPPPEIYFGYDVDYIDQCQMAELRGSLCMSFDFFKSKKLLQLWFLKDYHGGKWVKECNIKLSYEPQLSYAFAFTSDSCVLLNVQTSKKELKLCYYNTQKKGTPKTLGMNCSAMFYIDSFLPLPLGNR